ncbi:hypothetical protein [Thermoflexus hugenholtzii]
MNAELRSISTEVIYSILIFIIVVSFIQWLTKGFYGNNMLPPEHIPTTLIFTASSPAIYRIAKHVIKNRKNFKHLVDGEYRGQSSKLLRDMEATTASVVSDLTAEISSPLPTPVTPEATIAQTSVAQTSGEKITENPKHPIAEKEVRNEDSGNTKENSQDKEVDTGEKADEVDIVVTVEDLESLKSLRERLILLRRNWGLLSYE